MSKIQDEELFSRWVYVPCFMSENGVLNSRFIILREPLKEAGISGQLYNRTERQQIIKDALQFIRKRKDGSDAEILKYIAMAKVEDIRAIAIDKKQWMIFFISASGAEEPAYPTHFHFIYGAKKGDEGYDDPNLTITDTESFDRFYQRIALVLHESFSYDSDKHRYHTGAGKKNIARRICGGSLTNAFTIRPAYKVTVWDDRHIAIAKTIADAIRETLAVE